MYSSVCIIVAETTCASQAGISESSARTLSAAHTPSSTMSHIVALKGASAGPTCDINNYSPIPVTYSENAVSGNRTEIQNSFVLANLQKWVV